jgi:EmrB/QacA subfamily drug resistance transporter
MSITTPDPRRWWALSLLCAAQFIVILDTSIIGIALPAIQTSLGFTAEGLSWIFNGYVIVFGGLLLLGGRLSDLFGARRLLMLGFAILTAGSLVAGFAVSQEVLLAGRAIQGLGAALIAPSAMTILVGLFSHNGAELGKAFAFWGASAAAGGTAGVFLGGVITQWMSWEWTFLINIPLGVVVFAASPGLLRKSIVSKGGVDWIGAILITAALILSVYAIVTTEPGHWTSTATLAQLGGALVLVVVFVLVQAARAEPLLPLHIFKTPNLAMGNLLMALLGAAWIPLWFYLNLYLQQTLDFSAWESGLALVPMTVAIMVLMVGFSGKFIAVLGPKASLVLGLAIMGGALVMLARLPADGDFWIDVLPASLLAALGMSLAYIPATMVGVSGARPEETGLASGLINTTYQVGSAVGLAAMVAVAASYGSGPAEPSALLPGFKAAFAGAAIVAAAGAVLALVGLRSGKAAAVPAE